MNYTKKELKIRLTETEKGVKKMDEMIKVVGLDYDNKEVDAMNHLESMRVLLEKMVNYYKDFSDDEEKQYVDLHNKYQKMFAERLNDFSMFVGGYVDELTEILEENRVQL